MWQQDAARPWALRRGGTVPRSLFGDSSAIAWARRGEGQLVAGVCQCPPLLVILVCSFAQWAALQASAWSSTSVILWTIWFLPLPKALHPTDTPVSRAARARLGEQDQSSPPSLSQGRGFSRRWGWPALCAAAWLRRVARAPSERCLQGC